MGANTPEYHILGKRVAVGRLLLGTIVDSLEGLSRINNGEELLIDEERLDHFHDCNMEISRDIALTGNAGVAAKALALESFGGEASVDSERSFTDTYNVPDVHTWQFDPEASDYLAAMTSEKVQRFLKRIDYGPVYMVTGLKFGTKTSVNITRAKRVGGRLELGANIGTAVSVGPKLGSSRAFTVSQKGEEQTERILAIRVRKLRYKKKGFFGFGSSRVLTEEPSNAGAELVGDNRSKQKSRGTVAGLDFEVLEEDDTEDSTGSYRKISEPGVTWVVPKSW
ncbi:uncharacterized protein Z518_03913 [Rhinocladiella mackenziei CBS 650.93]|uniref:Uncharacterized protein n=1 Tax=Rhinocladiella mackenziei CBS 650.93 TaxID=1442369 RepID=A0A0D2IJQ3_9EURO|nr:uncharacterized protein Z518_03913 [Rhinocladiella mackenziei CBS 650.93]KIX05939.1 hypothetical protein Z518_03913 [Rhinocladiella mackenziei CBS 650.93]